MKNAIDWQTMFVPTISLVELMLRISVVYLGIILAMRLLRRQKGALNTADLLVLVLVADAAQNAMASEYKSVTEGLVLVGTLFFWNYALDTLAYRFKVIDRLLNPAPARLVTNGKFEQKQLRQQMLCEDDVYEQLREQGIDDLREVKSCCLEGDGHFSVIKVKSAGDDQPPPAKAAAGIA